MYVEQAGSPYPLRARARPGDEDDHTALKTPSKEHYRTHVSSLSLCRCIQRALQAPVSWWIIVLCYDISYHVVFDHAVAHDDILSHDVMNKFMHFTRIYTPDIIQASAYSFNCLYTCAYMHACLFACYWHIPLHTYMYVQMCACTQPTYLNMVKPNEDE